MSKYKPEKEVKKALSHLLKYSQQGIWKIRWQQFYDDSLAEVADILEVPAEKVFHVMDNCDSKTDAMIWGFCLKSLLAVPGMRKRSVWLMTLLKVEAGANHLMLNAI
jgi:hypothetical protein